MDPYLERHWGDVHHRLITYASDHLQPLLPKDLRARVEERVYVENPEQRAREIIPDVRIRKGKGKRRSGATAGGIAVAEPLIIQLDEPVTEGYIQIVDVSSGHRVVTVIEFLSPTNKLPGDNQEKYLQKRRELRDAGVNLVEIDLLRCGKRLLQASWHKLPSAYRTAYNAWVWRAARPRSIEIYRMPLRERLPAIHIPLRQRDADAPLDVQALVDQCYLNGDYEDDLNYQAEPDPLFAPAEARWADALLRRAGRRARAGTRRSDRHNGRTK